MEFTAEILENRRLTLDFFYLKIKVPAEFFKQAKPGQFLHVKISDALDPLMRRPLSLYTVEADGPGRFFASVLYRAVGHGTELLSRAKKGDKLSVLGPQGKGYWVRPQERSLIMVAGGYGVAPLYFLSQKLLAAKGPKRIKEIDVIVGAQRKELLLCVEEFKKLGVNLFITTNDGSLGRRGFVTDVLEILLSSKKLKKSQTAIYSCGPHAMLERVAALSNQAGVSCQVSMEERMGCSVGVCMGCVCKVLVPKPKKGMPPYRFARVCTEGPVFDTKQVLFK